MKRFAKGLAALLICGSLSFGLSVDKVEAAEISDSQALNSSAGTVTDSFDMQELYGPPPPPGYDRGRRPPPPPPPGPRGRDYPPGRHIMPPPPGPGGPHDPHYPGGRDYPPPGRGYEPRY